MSESHYTTKDGNFVLIERAKHPDFAYSARLRDNTGHGYGNNHADAIVELAKSLRKTAAHLDAIARGPVQHGGRRESR